MLEQLIYDCNTANVKGVATNHKKHFQCLLNAEENHRQIQTVWIFQPSLSIFPLVLKTRLW